MTPPGSKQATFQQTSEKHRHKSAYVQQTGKVWWAQVLNINWLVVEPTKLKNMLVKMGIIPR